MDCESHKSLVTALKKIADRLLKICDLKLKATEKINGEAGLPRVIRLSRRLKLSEAETNIMVYILVCQVSMTKEQIKQVNLFNF